MSNSSKFDQIDDLLSGWLDRYGLHVYTQHRDEEVRSIPVVDDNGKKYQIWIDVNQESKATVHAARESGNSQTWSKTCQLEELNTSLDQAYSLVEQWIKKDGSQRNWV